MIDIKVRVEDSLLAPLKDLGYNAVKDVDDAIKKAAFLIQATAKKKISQGARTGRFYERGRKVHRASAPGEPPKSDTGRLVNSIRPNFSFLTAEVGSDVNYSLGLEEGTFKTQPRPWLQPSFDENEGRVQQLVNDAIRRALK